MSIGAKATLFFVTCLLSACGGHAQPDLDQQLREAGFLPDENADINAIVIEVEFRSDESIVWQGVLVDPRLVDEKIEAVGLISPTPIVHAIINDRSLSRYEHDTILKISDKFDCLNNYCTYTIN